jgi:hypothetical protein
MIFLMFDLILVVNLINFLKMLFMHLIYYYYLYYFGFFIAVILGYNLLLNVIIQFFINLHIYFYRNYNLSLLVLLNCLKVLLSFIFFIFGKWRFRNFFKDRKMGGYFLEFVVDSFDIVVVLWVLLWNLVYNCYSYYSYWCCCYWQIVVFIHIVNVDLMLILL